MIACSIYAVSALGKFARLLLYQRMDGWHVGKDGRKENGAWAADMRISLAGVD